MKSRMEPTERLAGDNLWSGQDHRTDRAEVAASALPVRSVAPEKERKKEREKGKGKSENGKEKKKEEMEIKEAENRKGG